MSERTPIEDLLPGNDINIRLNRSSGVHTTRFKDYIELHYVVSGSAAHCVSGNQYDMKKGDLLFINCDLPHSFTSGDEYCYIVLLMRPAFVQHSLSTSGIGGLLDPNFDVELLGNPGNQHIYIRFDGKEFLEVESILFYMIDEVTARKDGYFSTLRAYTFILLTRIYRHMLKQPIPYTKNKNQAMIEVLEYLSENAFHNITISKIASRFYYNPAYLTRIYRETYGMTPINWVHRKRIEYAIDLLLHSDECVESIAEKIGYISKSEFYRIFKRYTGTTPAKYRAENNS